MHIYDHSEKYRGELWIWFIGITLLVLKPDSNVKQEIADQWRARIVSIDREGNGVRWVDRNSMEITQNQGSSTHKHKSYVLLKCGMDIQS